MPDPNQPVIPDGILAGTLNRREEPPVDELAALREALGRAKTVTAEELGVLAGPKGIPEGQEPEAAPPAEDEPKRVAVADQLAMFVSADGLRRIEQVSSPWTPPPQFIDLAMPGRRKVLALPGDDANAVETRRYRYHQTIGLRDLGLMVHVFVEA